MTPGTFDFSACSIRTPEWANRPRSVRWARAGDGTEAVASEIRDSKDPGFKPSFPRRNWARCGALLFAVLAAPTFAFAHEEAGAAAGLLAGLYHPVSGADHVLAMVAVGLWGAQLGMPSVWVLPVAFPMVMAFGGMLGLLGVPLPGVEIGIAVSALILGGLVVFELRPPLGAAAAIVAFFAIFHGHAHGTELPDGTSGLLYSIGFVVATGLLHAVGITIGLVHRWQGGRRAIQAAGAFVAAGGVFFLWQALA